MRCSVAILRSGSEETTAFNIRTPYARLASTRVSQSRYPSTVRDVVFVLEKSCGASRLRALLTALDAASPQSSRLVSSTTVGPQSHGSHSLAWLRSELRTEGTSSQACAGFAQSRRQ